MQISIIFLIIAFLSTASLILAGPIDPCSYNPDDCWNDKPTPKSSSETIMPDKYSTFLGLFLAASAIGIVQEFS
ncbi:hypothetical protein INT45_012784 [Circinella minor]|uniref:Uncharacterized protein n=1 Tax=Circinella minor TaxID=1195481 RepID=A0A8H7VKF6_9FUNG|nr:hypothetical protein INT45_012784 [Circinella minor]